MADHQVVGIIPVDSPDDLKGWLDSLVPASVLLALLGYALGNYFGYFIARVMGAVMGG